MLSRLLALNGQIMSLGRPAVWRPFFAQTPKVRTRTQVHARARAHTHTLTMCLCPVWPNLHAQEAPGEKQGAACALGGAGQTGPCVKSLSEVLVSLQDMDADVAALVYGSRSAHGLL